MSKLFSPLTIKEITFKNRIVTSPMCQYTATDGYANDWHLVHLGTRAVGGVGLVIAEATAIAPEGRITPGDLGLWTDRHIDGLRKITKFIHSQGAVAGIQIAHAGRKASCAVPWKGGRQLDEQNGGWQTVAPGDMPFLPGDRTPEPLSREGIQKVITGFASAAGRALAAGFRAIEIHGAHGYLLHEFLSPLSNNRTDEYGGSFENRIRLLTQVTEAVRKEWPAGNPLFVRISATDWSEGGWSLEESIKLAGILKDMGVDLIDCSSGGNIHDAKIPVAPGYQVPFSEAIRKTGILTGAVGFITTADQAESILQEGKADLVLLAKELLRNPYFALNAARDLGEDVEWPVQYLRAKKA
ncbi:MAG: NADH:flavin oxidoreductase/NADH oxidase [Bacteroidales bacterium]|jgi:2,4-dienoyl-CoA reductase-like NADH-dependent reductase (Old Yellow Enzyme family)|nr:NADH:flavin oxidoreductase/NADH oxidase [Bacteroidales bacterium]